MHGNMEQESVIFYVFDVFAFFIIASVEEKPPTIFKHEKSKMRPGRITQKPMMKHMNKSKMTKSINNQKMKNE